METLLTGGAPSRRGSFVVAKPAAVLLILSTMRIGPAVAGVDVWTNEGPEGAQISEIAVHPGDPDTVYVGTNGAGVFKSTDAGATWTAAREGLGHTQIDRIVIDPVDTQTIYAVTATTNAFPGRLFKSTDAGASWDTADDGLSMAPFSLAVDAHNPGTVYAGVPDRDDGGVFKSVDGAAIWVRIFGETPQERDFSSIALDPADSQIIYDSTRAGLRRTINGGKSWDPVGNGLPFATGVLSFAFDPLDTRIAYAGGSSGLGQRGVYRSGDQGENWSPTETTEAASVNDLFAVSGVSGALYGRTSDGVIKTTDAGSVGIS